MSMAILRVFFFVVTFQGLLSLQDDYYWREYTGTIPADAILAGQRINGKDVYIGQAYVNSQGLIVSEIFPGVPTVEAPINSKAEKIDSYIKILCGSQQNVYWIPANSTHLHTQLIDKKPIIGGHEAGGVLFVGRINYEGSTKVGKIAAFNVENALLYFSHKGAEKSVTSYEILLYNEKAVDVRILN